LLERIVTRYDKRKSENLAYVTVTAIARSIILIFQKGRKWEKVNSDGICAQRCACYVYF